MKNSILFILLFAFSNSCFCQGLNLFTYDNTFNLQKSEKSRYNGFDLRKNKFELRIDSSKIASSNSATFEILYSGNFFSILSAKSDYYRFRLLEDAFSLRFTYKDNSGTTISSNWIIPLVGAEISSYSYLARENWIHIAISYSDIGVIRIWINGKSDNSFIFKIKDFKHWIFNASYNIQGDASLNYFSITNHCVSKESNLDKYFNLINDEKKLSRKKSHDFYQQYKLDTFEYGPGFPSYDVSAAEQLKSFPDPRFKRLHGMPRNFPWMDIEYLSRVYKNGKSIVSPMDAIKITNELVTKWNYYIQIPTLRLDERQLQEKYTDPNEIYYHLIKFANDNLNIPVATILMQVQNVPYHAGFNSKVSYVISQNLSPHFYLRDKKNNPIMFKGRKWLNPFTSDEIIKKDGLVSSFYINQLGKFLKRPINIFNENGEWFGNQWPASLLEKSPEVMSFIKQKNLNTHEFNGWMLNKFDSIYSHSIRSNTPYKNAKFTFYNVSATKEIYWPSFKERMNTNSLFMGSVRSTPSFYPSIPSNWKSSLGPLNGYGAIAEGRVKEIELGVRQFAPFVSAGWDLEEKNIRPAQWLSLLKAMVMLGADFFHVGYFNVTGGKGWPNGKGPNDPRGYIYQAAIPTYAQALGSHFYDFLENGILINPNFNSNPNYNFRFKGSKENHLIIVRKLKNSYILYGSVQPSSNFVGNINNVEKTQIELDGSKIQFLIRKQGSIYYYKPDKDNPVFYQLDGWHEYRHPYYWSKDFYQECEFPQNKSLDYDCVKTEEILSKNDYTNFISFVRLNKGENLEYDTKFEEKGTLYLRIRTKGLSRIQIKYSNSEISEYSINEEKFTWKKISAFENLNENSILSIKVIDGSVDLDKFIISKSQFNAGTQFN